MGAHGQLTRDSKVLSPETKYKRSKNVFAITSIALTLVPPGTKLLEIPAQFLIGSPGTLSGPIDVGAGVLEPANEVPPPRPTHQLCMFPSIDFRKVFYLSFSTNIDPITSPT